VIVTHDTSIARWTKRAIRSSTGASCPGPGARGGLMIWSMVRLAWSPYAEMCFARRSRARHRDRRRGRDHDDHDRRGATAKVTADIAALGTNLLLVRRVRARVRAARAPIPRRSRSPALRPCARVPGIAASAPTVAQKPAQRSPRAGNWSTSVTGSTPGGSAGAQLGASGRTPGPAPITRDEELPRRMRCPSVGAGR